MVVLLLLILLISNVKLSLFPQRGQRSPCGLWQVNDPQRGMDTEWIYVDVNAIIDSASLLINSVELHSNFSRVCVSIQWEHLEETNV